MLPSAAHVMLQTKAQHENTTTHALSQHHRQDQPRMAASWGVSISAQNRKSWFAGLSTSVCTQTINIEEHDVGHVVDGVEVVLGGTVYMAGGLNDWSVCFGRAWVDCSHQLSETGDSLYLCVACPNYATTYLQYGTYMNNEKTCKRWRTCQTAGLIRQRHIMRRFLIPGHTNTAVKTEITAAT